MPVPVIVGAAAAIAARLAARKLAQEAAKKAVTRTVGGITGKGASKINPVYKETGNSVKVLKAGSKPLTQRTAAAARENEAARIAEASARMKKFAEGRMESWSSK
jgi:hypothetical protein